MMVDNYTICCKKMVNVRIYVSLQEGNITEKMEVTKSPRDAGCLQNSKYDQQSSSKINSHRLASTSTEEYNL